jgi:predicted Rossmann-fold nucleotide-binding protein
VGTDFWLSLVTFVQDTLIREGTVGAEELQFIRLADTADEVMQHTRDAAVAFDTQGVAKPERV